MLIDNVYDKSSNSCSKKTITATTTTTNSSMNCMASHKLELSAVKRPFQQIRPNATCYSFEEPIDHRNSFQSNVVDYCHTANFSDHDPYCLNAHCYCRSCDYSDSNLLMRDPDPESNLSNMDNFGYREDDYNYSPLLPQAQICPVYNGVVYKEPENVYSAPLKKPRLCPLTKTVTESYDNITFPTDCSYLNGFQFNNSVNSRCGAPYSYMFCEPSSLDDTNKCIRCIDRGTSNYQFNHYLPYHGQRQQHHTFGGFLNRTVIY
ncbi:unnamed protein product [Heterobilharzia americana]|nr:unnamed protein product [Heterobilharzia americana]